ncbi:MAG: glycosyltransferase family 87 protein [Thermoguttaceae bacterium]
MEPSPLRDRLIAVFRSRWFAPWRLLVTLMLILAIWGVADVRRRGYAVPVNDHRTDLTVYTEAGAAFFDGRPPYQVHNPRGWTYVYPPILAMLLAPLHRLPPQHQVMVWFFLCMAMGFDAYRQTARIVAILGRRDGDRTIAPACRFPWLGLIAAAAAALPTLNCLQRGQVTIVLLYFLLLGLRWMLDGRPFLGGIALALPVAIKMVPALPIALVVLVQLVAYVRQRRSASEPSQPLGRQLFGSSLGIMTGLALFFLLVPAAMVGWHSNLHHLQTWNRLVLSNADENTTTPGYEKDTHSVRNQCLGNALYRLGNFGAYLWLGGPEDPMIDEEDHPPPRMMDQPVVHVCLLLVRLSLLAALLLTTLRLGADRDVRLSQAAAFGLGCAALLILSPVARNHYFLLIAPAVLFVPLWLSRRGWRRGAALLALTPGLLILLQYTLLPYVGRIGLLGLGLTVWLLTAMAMTARTRPLDDPAIDLQPSLEDSTHRAAA